MKISHWCYAYSGHIIQLDICVHNMDYTPISLAINQGNSFYGTANNSASFNPLNHNPNP